MLVPLSFAAEGQFVDVPSSALHFEAIDYLRSKDIISGYKDNTFRPERTVNRAEFLKVLTKLLVSQTEIDECTKKDRARFDDVPENSWFAPFVCAAKQKEFIDGYEDNTFHPAETINIAEASKILTRAFHLTLPPADAALWFKAPITALADARAIPPDVEATGEALTRGVLAEMLWRLKEGKMEESSADAATILAAKCEWMDDRIPGVDIQEARRVWVSWINGVRADVNIAPVMQDKQLIRTATVWSERARDVGGITHKRPGQTAYYDYKGIESWFSKLDIEFANVKSTTYTESIGWGVFTCKKDDCTQALITAMRSTFDFYMSEKGKAYAPHYNSIVQPQFRLIGTGIVVDKNSGRYYLTTHYGTSITSDPDPVCP